MPDTGTITAARWIARILSLAYLAFFLFMFIGETFGPGEPQTLRLKPYEIGAFILLGTYFVSLLLAWKWERLFGVLSFFLLLTFTIALRAWSMPFFMIGFIPPVLYLLSGFGNMPLQNS